MTGYERVKEDELYYAVNAGGVSALRDDKREADKLLYEDANYYSDRTVAENNVRADKLMRQLRRFAVEHNDGEIEWNNTDERKYLIIYNFNDKTITATWNECVKYFGQIYFTSREIAEQAIEEFKDELLWYFTEYTDHIVEDNKKVELECELCGNPEKLQAMYTLGFEYCPMCGEEL